MMENSIAELIGFMTIELILFCYYLLYTNAERYFCLFLIAMNMALFYFLNDIFFIFFAYVLFMFLLANLHKNEELVEEW